MEIDPRIPQLTSGETLVVPEHRRSIGREELSEATWGETSDDPVSAVGPDGAPLWDPTRSLETRATLGEGGTAIVHLAVQHPLGREVAVKRVRVDIDSPGRRQLLLREAWITGALEHPNIVPVYDVTLDEDGRPLIVLKRIRGEPWADLMRTDGWRALAGDADHLEWNLRILVQVCRAVHFAHDRGYIHRDLKPENVMIAEHGEVLVVDWGLALRAGEEGDPRIPIASEPQPLAGTPAYMAPEMLGEGALISRATDVFLLGAILYEILAGDAPYVGEVDDALFDHIREASPPLPEDCTPWLAAICQRAMQPDPEHRYPSVEDIRRALQNFLRHRGADVSAARASQRLATLAVRSVTGDLRRAELYELYGSCRFGFRQALQAWGEHDAARDGLQQAALLMVEYELRRRDADAAELMARNLSEPPPGLAERIAAVRGEVDAESERVAALARIGESHDPSIGRSTRLSFVLTLGLCWTILPLLAWAYEGSLPFHHPYGVNFATTLVFLTTAAAGAFAARAEVKASAFNRGVVGAVLLVLLGQLIFDVAAMLAGVGPDVAHALRLSIWFVVVSMAALTIERRTVVSATGYAVGCVVAANDISLLLPTIAVTNLVLSINAAWIWGRVSTRR